MMGVATFWASNSVIPEAVRHVMLCRHLDKRLSSNFGSEVPCPSPQPFFNLLSPCCRVLLVLLGTLVPGGLLALVEFRDSRVLGDLRERLDKLEMLDLLVNLELKYVHFGICFLLLLLTSHCLLIVAVVIFHPLSRNA